MLSLLSTWAATEKMYVVYWGGSFFFTIFKGEESRHEVDIEIKKTGLLYNYAIIRTNVPFDVVVFSSDIKFKDAHKYHRLYGIKIGPIPSPDHCSKQSMRQSL